jgi:hypothetical protein
VNILFGYGADPYTTAIYWEKALRKDHNVITCGPCTRGKRHTIECAVDADIQEIS